MADGGPGPRFLFIDSLATDHGQVFRDTARRLRHAHVSKEVHRKERSERIKAWRGASAMHAQDSSRAEAGGSGRYSARPRCSDLQQLETDDDYYYDYDYNGASGIPPFNHPIDCTIRAKHLTFPNSSRATVERFPYPAPGPQTILGAGRLDPFNLYPVEDVPPVAHQIIDHARVHTWTNIIPYHGKSSVIYPVMGSWLALMRQFPENFYAYLYCGSLHRSFVQGGLLALRSQTAVHLAFKTKAIIHLNRRLQTLVGPAPDSLISTILTLGINEPLPELPSAQDMPYPESPLAKAQTLDLIGNMKMVPAHVQALYTLVEQRGGIRSITTFGIAETIALGDLIGASVGVTKPRIEQYWPTESLVESGRFKMDFFALSMSQHFGFGFGDLKQRTCQVLQNITELLPAIREISVAVDTYARSGSRSPDLADMVGLRNSVQWRLTSLPSSPIGSLITREHALYEAVRLAALIYSDMVIFPLPPLSNVRKTLADLLSQALHRYPLHQCFDDGPYLVLWLLAMGGMAARPGLDATWYQERFRKLADSLWLHDYDAFESKVSPFLWWSYVCDAPARDFWNDTHPRIDDLGPAAR